MKVTCKNCGAVHTSNLPLPDATCDTCPDCPKTPNDLKGFFK